MMNIMNPANGYHYNTLSRVFPFRLHTLLEHHEHDMPTGIAWSHAGDSFRITSKKDLTEAMGVYFNRKCILTIHFSTLLTCF
jgi:hypothetical protein